MIKSLGLWLSLLFIVLSVASLAFFGLRFGIEFTGGSIMEVSYEEEAPSVQDIQERLVSLELGTVTVQKIGENRALLRTRDLDAASHRAVLAALGDVREERFESVGPVIGSELREGTLSMLAAASLVILVYVALAFRRVSQPLRSWQYSLASFAPLLHDILVPLGVFAILGRTAGYEVTVPVVVALLTVFGYSVNNTVVTFDRVRENLLLRQGADFADTVARSVRQTLGRNLAASGTTLLVLLALLFFGGATLQPFALALSVGIAAGTFSSLALGPALLTLWAGRPH